MFLSQNIKIKYKFINSWIQMTSKFEPNWFEIHTKKRELQANIFDEHKNVKILNLILANKIQQFIKDYTWPSKIYPEDT